MYEYSILNRVIDLSISRILMRCTTDGTFCLGTRHTVARTTPPGYSNAPSHLCTLAYMKSPPATRCRGSTSSTLPHMPDSTARAAMSIPY